MVNILLQWTVVQKVNDIVYSTDHNDDIVYYTENDVIVYHSISSFIFLTFTML